MNWLWAFLFTQAVEIPVYIAGARTRPDEAFCASAMTHPIVWFVFPWAFDHLYAHVPLSMAPWFFGSIGRTSWTPAYVVMVLFAEAFAIVAEGLYLRWLGKRAPFRWSLAANVASVVLGLLSRALFGVP